MPAVGGGHCRCGTAPLLGLHVGLVVGSRPVAARTHDLSDQGGCAGRRSPPACSRAEWSSCATATSREVAKSRCVREYDCRKSGRRSGCWDVAVTFTCTYDVTDWAGTPATAILIVSRNDFYDPHSEFADAREPYIPGGMELGEAGDKLCTLARRCGNFRRPRRATEPAGNSNATLRRARRRRPVSPRSSPGAPGDLLSLRSATTAPWSRRSAGAPCVSIRRTPGPTRVPGLHGYILRTGHDGAAERRLPADPRA